MPKPDSPPKTRRVNLKACPKCGCKVFQGAWTIEELQKKDMMTLVCVNNSCPGYYLDWYPCTGRITARHKDGG